MDTKIENNTYPGGKGSSGTFQKICNTIPAHLLFVEGFGGLGQITQHKKGTKYPPVLTELNPATVRRLQLKFGNSATIIEASAFDYLPGLISHLHMWYPGVSSTDVVIYLDPPYLHETRADNNIYGRKYELTREQHVELLKIIRRLSSAGFNVIVSHYKNDLYDKQLTKFNSFKYTAQTRGGKREETLYFNFDMPVWDKHEYSYVGNNFRERAKIKEKKDRYVNKFQSMSELERAAIMNALFENRLITIPKAIQIK